MLPSKDRLTICFAHVAYRGEQRRRYENSVPDSADVDEQFAFGPALEQFAPQPPDHCTAPVRADLSKAASVALRRGIVERWQTARARASATSGGRGGSSR